MFDSDLDEGIPPSFPRTAFNFHSMNSSLLEPWSRQQTIKKEPLMKLNQRIIIKNQQHIRRAGTQELFRKRFKKNENEAQRKNIPISTLTFYHAQTEKKQIKKHSHVLKIKKTAKSQGKFEQKPHKQIIFNEEVIQDKQPKGIRPSVDRMSHLRNKIQYQKKLQYILNKRESIFSKPIVSEVLLTPKDFMKDQSFTDATKHNISYLEDKKKEVKKPRKALFVGLAKLKGTQKKQKISHVKGHSCVL